MGEPAPGTEQPMNDDATQTPGRLSDQEASLLARPASARQRLIYAFWGAAALSLLCALFPEGRYVLYPFALLATWAHEMGHGLTALLVGGTFDKLVLYPDLGGTAYCASTRMTGPLVSAGGLLGPAIAGGFVIVLGSRPRTARGILAALAVCLFLSLAIWVRNLFGAAAIGVIGLITTGLALKGPELARLLVAQLVGIQLCLGSLASFDYMFTKEFTRADGRLLSSDTQNMAEIWFLPYWFWGALIAALSLVILAASFYLAWVRPVLSARKQRQVAVERVVDQSHQK